MNMTREMIALSDAANRPGGWALFNRKTTERLAEKGYFETAKHPAYGDRLRITEAGREALKTAKAAQR